MLVTHASIKISMVPVSMVLYDLKQCVTLVLRLRVTSQSEYIKKIDVLLNV